MKRFRFLSILIIAATLAGCGTETVNNSATAPGGTTGAAVQTAARPTDGYETQSIQTEGQTQSAPASGNTSVSTLEPAVSSEPTPVAFEAQNGINNENIIQLGNYIYYVSGERERDQGVTYRMDVRTGKPEQFNDVQMLNMVYHDGWIYYIYYEREHEDPYHEEDDEIYFSRIKPDGSQKGPRSEMPHQVRNVFIYDGYVYAISDMFIYNREYDDRNIPVRFKLYSDGTLGERETIFNDRSIRTSRMAVYEGWLYYTMDNDDGMVSSVEREDYGLYKCRINGADIQKLVNAEDYLKGQYVTFFIADGWLYYSINNLDANGDAIYKMSLDGSQKITVYDNCNLLYGLNYMDGCIYFETENNGRYEYCRILANGEDFEKLANISSLEHDVIGVTADCLIYNNITVKGGLYKMDLNGGNVVELSAAYY